MTKIMNLPESQYEAALHEVLEALREAPRQGEPDCALCRRAACSVQRGLKSFFAEFVNDPQVREGWRAARGFCAQHVALVATRGDVLAVAILYADLARLTRERLERGSQGGRIGGRLLTLLRRRRSLAVLPCPACTLESAADARYAAALAAGLTEASGDIWEAMERGRGLCVAHTQQVMESATPIVAARLRRREVERLGALQAELEEIVRKNDYRFRGEPWGPERDAWLRALDKLNRPRT